MKEIADDKVPTRGDQSSRPDTTSNKGRGSSVGTAPPAPMGNSFPFLNDSLTQFPRSFLDEPLNFVKVERDATKDRQEKLDVVVHAKGNDKR